MVSHSPKLKRQLIQILEFRRDYLQAFIWLSSPMCITPHPYLSAICRMHIW